MIGCGAVAEDVVRLVCPNSLFPNCVVFAIKSYLWDY